VKAKQRLFEEGEVRAGLKQITENATLEEQLVSSQT
jgi:hypothetical protein